jgi:hypothetical protein
MRYSGNRALVSLFLLSSMLAAQQQPPAAAPQGLNLVVVEGEGAINNIKLRTSRETIVQVEDENHKPVGGAAVLFLLPNDGPGGTFAAGGKSATVISDNAGRAVMPRLQPNQNPGSYTIRATASYRGLSASTAINQSAIAGASAGLSSASIIGIIAGVAAGGAVAVVVATRKGSSTPDPSGAVPVLVPAGTPTGTVSAGSGVTFGPPR